MKPYILLAFLQLLICSTLLAQGNERVKVKAGGDEKLAAMSYRYQDFKEGRVHFRRGTTGRSLMNFNLLMGEMHFINPKRDTLALAGLELVKYIAIDSDTFYYDALNNEFLELIASYGDAQLMVSRKYRYSSTHKNAAYGQYSTTQSSASLNNIEVEGRTVNLSNDQYSLYIKSSRYFISAKGGDLLPASKSNFWRVYPTYKSKIQDFIKSNNTNFSKEEDLISLMEFCNSID